MENENNLNQDESQIKEGDLLNSANNILSLLNYSQKLENEEDLFLDDFYVSIIGNLLSDIQPEIVPGGNIKEKAQVMDKLVKSLSQAIEIDLPHINGADIILNHDKVSAKNLLDVISELIKTIIDNNLEEVEEEKNEENEKIHPETKNNIEKQKVLNKNIEEYQLSNEEVEQNEFKKNENKILQHNKTNDDNLEYEENSKQSQESNLKMNSSCFEPLHFQKMMNQIKDKENKVNNSYMRQTYSQNDLSRYERNREDAEEKENNFIEYNTKGYKEKEEEIEQINNNTEENPIMNVSNISDMNKEKDEKDMNNSSKSDKNIENDFNSNKKKENEIPDLVDYEEKEQEKKGSQKQNSIKVPKEKYNYFNKEGENNDSKNKENEESEVDMNYSENKTANSMPPAYIKLNIGASEDKDYMDDNNNSEKKKSESIFDDSHIIKGSQMDKSNRFNEEEELEAEEIEDINSKNKSNKKGDTNSKKGSNVKSKKIQNNFSYGEKEHNQSNKKEIKKEEQIPQENKEENLEEKEKSQKTNNNTGLENKTSLEDDNVPFNDESFKYQIMKEFHKIYGDKLDYLFLKHNSQFSPNIMELALRNIKLAKEKMLKVGGRFPPKDDPKILEYLQKYEKELNLMFLNFNKEQKKQEILKEMKLNEHNKKMKDKEKLEKIQKLKTENEIERRQKAKEIRSYHKRMKLGNNIYKNALELEKQKNLEKMKEEKEIINKENEEKRKVMITLEKYYKDQIKMLKDILSREKKERDNEHREYMI